MTNIEARRRCLALDRNALLVLDAAATGLAIVAILTIALLPPWVSVALVTCSAGGFLTAHLGFRLLAAAQDAAMADTAAMISAAARPAAGDVPRIIIEVSDDDPDDYSNTSDGEDTTPLPATPPPPVPKTAIRRHYRAPQRSAVPKMATLASGVEFSRSTIEQHWSEYVANRAPGADPEDVDEACSRLVGLTTLEVDALLPAGCVWLLDSSRIIGPETADIGLPVVSATARAGLIRRAIQAVEPRAAGIVAGIRP